MGLPKTACIQVWCVFERECMHVRKFGCAMLMSSFVVLCRAVQAGSLGDQLLRAGAARPIMLQLALGHREPLTGGSRVWAGWSCVALCVA
jgi:hypothetical protein